MERAIEKHFGSSSSSAQEVGRRRRRLLAEERQGRQLSAAARQPWEIGEAAQQVSDTYRGTDSFVLRQAVMQLVTDLLRM